MKATMAPDDSNQPPPAKPAPGPMTFRRAVKRALTPFVVVLATLYFVIDALFLLLVRPLADWIGRQAIFPRLRAWIQSLGPYPTLALFLIPLIILEPVKPVAAYLVGTGHYMSGTAVLIIGELLKITIVERLFHLGRDKLMTIAAFAWSYNFLMGWLAYLKSLPPWQAVMRRFIAIKARARLLAAAARRMAAAVRRVAADIKQRWTAYWADPA
jgi:hypothetical protein